MRRGQVLCSKTIEKLAQAYATHLQGRLFSQAQLSSNTIRLKLSGKSLGLAASAVPPPDPASLVKRSKATAVKVQTGSGAAHAANRPRCHPHHAGFTGVQDARVMASRQLPARFQRKTREAKEENNKVSVRVSAGQP